VRILLTGHRGRIGPAIAQRLAADGHAVRGFDLVDGNDIMDAAAVRRAAHGMDMIVHVAGLAGDRPAAPADIIAVNLIGTSNVLLAAEAASIGRVVYMSSGRSLGLLERNPDYLPLDDDHRGLPSQPYALAKWLAEEMCAAFTHRTGVETICLRPVAVFSEADYARAMQSPVPAAGTLWPLGVHLHVLDLADAVAAAVGCAPVGHCRLLLCAADIADRRPTLDLVAARLPHVAWRGGDEFRRDPYRALVDISRAQKVLGWSPHHTWPGRQAARAVPAHDAT
jgi:nucleoside-diphosphate-sugar epimerase